MIKHHLLAFAILGAGLSYASESPTDAPSSQGTEQTDQINQSNEESVSVESESVSNAANELATEGKDDLASTSTSPEPYFEDDDSCWEQTEDPFEASDNTDDEVASADELPLPPLPGEDVKFKLKVHQSNFHDLHGRADSEIGKLRFKSKLMPSNEVKMDLKIKGEEEDLLFKAYFDLANFTMELDGGGAILTVEQKKMMEHTAEHLRQNLIKKFKDEIPHHSLLTVQMLSYWSTAPAGHAHVKREIVSQ